MKRKRSLYLLLPLVLIIWSAVFFQFLSFDKEEVDIPKNTNIPLKIESLKSVQPVNSLDVNYRDPFLGKIYIEKSSANNKNRKKRQPLKLLSWPDIAYKGIVSDQKDKIKVYMITINGESFLLRRGQSARGVILLRGDRKNITLLYDGVKRNFKI